MVYNVIRGSEFMCDDVSFGTGFEIFGRMCRLIVCWSAEMCCCGLDGMFTFVFCVTHSNDQTRQTCTDLNTGVVRERQRFFWALRAWGTRAWPLAPTVTAIRRVISYG